MYVDYKSIKHVSFMLRKSYYLISVLIFKRLDKK